MLLNRFGNGRSHAIFGFLQHIFQAIPMWWQIFIHAVLTKTRNGYLNDIVFAFLPTAYVSPEIDLFASSANAKLPRYISWLPDPHAYAVDAFIVSWQDLTFYAFPPFSLLPRVLAKIIQDKAIGLLINPKWTIQSWFPLVLTLLLIQHH